jgi:hypothetical protein
MKRQNWTILSLSVLGFALLLLRHGYLFGDMDQAEVLPLMLHCNDNSLYPKDFYLQTIIPIIPNARWIFAYAFSIFGADALPSVFFFFHLVNTIFLLAGSIKVATTLKIDPYIAFGGLMAYLLLLLHHIPGANDWYVPQLLSENFAFATGIWAVYYAQTDRQSLVALLLAIGTLFHPLAGLQFAVVIYGSKLLCGHFPLKGFLIYASTGGIFFLLTTLAYQSNFKDNGTLFKVLIQFRQPHHSWPAAFPLVGWALTVAFAAALYVQAKTNAFIKLVLAIILIGCIIYVPFVQWVESITVAQTQWFKTLSLVFALGSMAAAALAKAGLEVFFEKKWPFRVRPALPFCAGLSIVALLLAVPQANILHKTLKIGRAAYDKDAALVDISLKAKTSTPKDALFVVPPDVTAFQYYAERSVYVSLKAIVHRSDFMEEWFQRIQNIYGMKLEKPASKQIKQANEFYHQQIRRKHTPPGAEYALVELGNNYPYPIIAQNEGFMIIKL